MSYSIYSRTFPLTASAHDLFKRVAHESWAVLLESAHPTHPDSRFDILSADPVATICTIHNETTIRYRDGTSYISHERALDVLAQEQEKLFGKFSTSNTTLPFIGGAIGLLGYDLGRQLETIPNIADADINVPDMAVGLYDWAWVLDKQQKTAHFVVYGNENTNEQRWLWWSQQSEINQPIFALNSPWQANMNQHEYCDRFSKIQAYLRSGDCYQINLTQRFTAHYSGDEWQAYQILCKHNQAPFSGFMRLDKSAILSVSPERFLSLTHDQIETKPIKGTRPRSVDPETDLAAKNELQHALKDRSENLMIVDLLRNDIGRVSVPGTVTVPKLFEIESFPAVHHLVSTITGTLAPELNACDLLSACFPGGSITGAPKVRAMQIIEELEPQRRNAYCGSLFYISQNGRMDSSITIRTLIASEQKIHVWAGGGIVADSEADAEYQETFDKLGKILPILEYQNEC